VRHLLDVISAYIDSVPVLSGSSVGVERRFNTGRDVISLRRASLKPETIHKLMTGRSALELEKVLAATA
jgi:hypothetical protein